MLEETIAKLKHFSKYTAQTYGDCSFKVRMNFVGLEVLLLFW